MEKKLRIQLFDSDGRMLNDRLVTQDPEMVVGPKLAHDGPLRIEFTLETKDDIEKAKDYLDRLVGNLPLSVKKAKKLNKDLGEDVNFRQALLDNIIIPADNQDTLIGILRNEGFVFMMSDYLITFDDLGLQIKDVHKDKYQWMIRLIKPGRNPRSDKFDPMLVIGIQLLPEHNEKVVVYMDTKFHKSYKIPVPSKPKEVFKKTTMLKFPPYMVEKEREKFRYELRQYELNPERNYSKFFIRWKEWVENLPELSQNKKDQESD